MKETIRQLLELQAIDAESYLLHQQRAAIPAQLRADQQAYEQAVVAAREQIAKRKQMLAELHNFRVAIESAVDRTKKLQGKQSGVKKNVEYQALTQEIKMAELAGIKQELAYKNHAAAIEAAEAALAELEQGVAEKKKKLLARADEAKKQLGDIQHTLKSHQARRRAVEQRLDKQALGVYNHLLERRAPNVVVSANRSVCGGCNINLPPQVIADIMKADRLVTCENCARIMYLEDEPQS